MKKIILAIVTVLAVCIIGYTMSYPDRQNMAAEEISTIVNSDYFFERKIKYSQLAGIANFGSNIVVARPDQNCLEILDSFGEIKGQVGNLGNASGEFVRPTGLAVWNDRLYVIDSGNSRVQILDENFHMIRSIELDQLSDSQNNYYMDISISDDETLFLTNNCANEEKSCVSLIGSNGKKQRSSEPFYGFITCTDKTVYGVNTFVHWKDSHSFHASGGESYLYEITAHGKLKKVFAFPYKYCPTDFCIDGKDIYVLTCAWARLDHYKLDGTYVETLIEFEELSPESYLVRTEDGFWVSDATQGTLYHIKRSNSPSEVS